MKSDIHVLPKNDLREHIESRDCWCGVHVQKEPDMRVAVVIHKAADGRDFVERHGVQ